MYCKINQLVKENLNCVTSITLGKTFQTPLPRGNATCDRMAAGKEYFRMGITMTLL